MKWLCMTPLKRVKRKAEAEHITGIGAARREQAQSIGSRLRGQLTKIVVDGGWINDGSVEVVKGEGRQEEHLVILFFAGEMPY